MNIYNENGFSSREEYLDSLREDYGSSLVNRILPRFNPSQDFDALVVSLEEAYFNGQEEEVEEEEEEDEEEGEEWDEEE